MRHPVKHAEEAHPVPDQWRPTLSQIVSAFVERDYRLARGIDGVDVVEAATASHIGAYITDYGEQLVALPQAAWDSSFAQWLGAKWEVRVDLWTAGEGASDLVLHVDVYEVGAEFRFAVYLVYVP